MFCWCHALYDALSKRRKTDFFYLVVLVGGGLLNNFFGEGGYFLCMSLYKFCVSLFTYVFISSHDLCISARILCFFSIQLDSGCPPLLGLVRNTHTHTHEKITKKKIAFSDFSFFFWSLLNAS